MRWRTVVATASAVGSLFAATLFGAGEKPKALAVGQPAPDIAGTDRTGKPLKLVDYQGKKTVVVFFFPKAFTPGCTVETRELGKAYADLAARDVEVIGVSSDKAKDLDEFCKAEGADYPMVSSGTDNAWHKAFGIAPMARSTFIIGKDGKIAGVLERVNVRTHVDDVKAVLARLDGGATSRPASQPAER